MLKPHTAIASLLIAALSACACFSIPGTRANAQAQSQEILSPEAALGVELYKKGDMAGAIKALRAAVKLQKDDAGLWYVLGLALNGNGDMKDSRKAFERAIKLRPDFAIARAALAYILLLANKTKDAVREAKLALENDSQNAEARYVIGVVTLRAGDASKSLEEAEAVLKLKPDFAPALLLKSQALLGVYVKRIAYRPKEAPEERLERNKGVDSLFRASADSLEKYIQLSPQAQDLDVWQEQLKNMRLYTRTAARIIKSDEFTTKVKITARPEPQYTESARRAQISGTVILRAVFDTDGIVKHIFVLQYLPYGLTDRAIKAARKIKFIPATKDGQPVPQHIQIEYNFNLY